MTIPNLTEILALEKMVWEALVSGDAAIDGMLLDDQFLGVYETGFSDKAGHVGQLATGPTVARYSISEARLITPHTGLAMLCYRADYLRTGRKDAEAMYVSSLW